MNVKAMLLALLAAGAALPVGADTTNIPGTRQGSIYKLTSTNRPGPEGQRRLSPRDVLRLLDQPMSPAPTPSMVRNPLYQLDAGLTNTLEGALSTEEWIRLTAAVEDAEGSFRDRKVEEAVAALQAEIVVDPNPIIKAKLHNRIASYLFRSRRYDDALSHMREAVRLNPGDASALCNLSAVLLTMNRIEEADTYLRKIDTTSVKNLSLLFSIFFNKACVGSLRKNRDEALLNLIRAAQSDPKAALTALGDPQLDGLRDSLEFLDLKSRLEALAQEGLAP